jgi:hypothetical protein
MRRDNPSGTGGFRWRGNTFDLFVQVALLIAGVS